MLDFKKLYLSCLIPYKISFRIIFSIYAFIIGSFIIVYHTNLNYYATQIDSSLNVFLFIQVLCIIFMNYDKSIFATLPIKNINLYPIACFSSFISLFGLPITPKQIYLATLKIRTLIIFVVSMLFILIDFFMTGKLFISNIMVQLSMLFVFLIFFEGIYFIYRTGYKIIAICCMGLFIPAININSNSVPNMPITIFFGILCLCLIFIIQKKLNILNFSNNDMPKVLNV